MKNAKGKFLNSFSNFNVSKYTKITGSIPVVILIVALVVIIALGATGGSYTNAVGIGIDFEGGTVLNVTLGEEAVDNYDYHMNRIKNAIQADGVVVSYIQKQESNNETQSSISFRYKNISNDDNEINKLNETIKSDVEKLYENTEISSFKITYESIGATAASDLLSKAGIAIAVSMLLILIYIMIRFTLISAFAAIIALIHDVFIMFALTVICRVQINTSYVAAMITIIAYSINNTIIIFDRCREYIKPLKGQKNIDYVSIGDLSVRENMTRSVYTTLTTMITVIFLAAFGSDTLREFCVPIILGLIAGFYSSVFLATPMWSAMSASFDKYKEKHMQNKAVSYNKSTDDEEDKTVVKPFDSDTDNVKIAGQKTPKSSQGKPKGKPVYKYSKKNTTFKKK